MIDAGKDDDDDVDDVEDVSKVYGRNENPRLDKSHIVLSLEDHN